MINTAQEELAKALKASGRKDTQAEINRSKRPKGLGDVIEKVTTVTGIKFATRMFSEVTGKDCGCKKRKELLNKKFPLKDND